MYSQAHCLCILRLTAYVVFSGSLASLFSGSLPMYSQAHWLGILRLTAYVYSQAHCLCILRLPSILRAAHVFSGSPPMYSLSGILTLPVFSGSLPIYSLAHRLCILSAACVFFELMEAN